MVDARCTFSGAWIAKFCGSMFRGKGVLHEVPRRVWWCCLNHNDTCLRCNDNGSRHAPEHSKFGLQEVQSPGNGSHMVQKCVAISTSSRHMYWAPSWLPGREWYFLICFAPSWRNSNANISPMNLYFITSSTRITSYSSIPLDTDDFVCAYSNVKLFYEVRSSWRNLAMSQHKKVPFSSISVYWSPSLPPGSTLTNLNTFNILYWTNSYHNPVSGWTDFIPHGEPTAWLNEKSQRRCWLTSRTQDTRTWV